MVRGYNIAVIVFAQYLASTYILSEDDSIIDIVLNPILFILVVSTSFIIAAGYIINNFYDSEKDIINKPAKVVIDNVVSNSTKLRIYFLFNFIGTLLSLFVSVRAFLFMSVFVFLIWIYSHKLKRVTLLGNIMAAMLVIFPFFAIFLYYKNISMVIILHATFISLLFFIRELVKDLNSLRGDLMYNYNTIPVRYGAKVSKIIITATTILTLVPSYLLTTLHEVGAMKIYFYFSLGVLSVFVVGLWTLKGVRWQLFQYNIIKLLIVAGVFSIALIPYSI